MTRVAIALSAAAVTGGRFTWFLWNGSFLLCPDWALI